VKEETITLKVRYDETWCSLNDFRLEIEQFNKANKPHIQVEEVQTL